jgi:N6-adenosine-specific RNA methylase IME4
MTQLIGGQLPNTIRSMFSEFPSGRYRVIYADPPWSFKTYSDKGKSRSAERHYSCMSLDDIKALPVGQIADNDCTLVLWTTVPHLQQAFEVIEAWGFSYKCGAVWVKPTRDGKRWRMGTGYWFRGNPEHLLVATRGRSKPTKRGAGGVGLIVAPRRDHSRKPDEVYERIERLVAGPYIELFARQKRPGWDAWGNEVLKLSRKLAE